jgi:hypothetical protein
MITIEFEMTEGPMVFRDAIVLPDNHNFTQENIAEIKQQRFDDWLSMVSASEAEE